MNSEDSVIRAKMIQHLEKLMGDVGLHRWEHVRAYHGVWLNQLEQRRFTWDDVEAKLRFRTALVWHAPATTSTNFGMFIDCLFFTLELQLPGVNKCLYFEQLPLLNDEKCC